MNLLGFWGANRFIRSTIRANRFMGTVNRFMAEVNRFIPGVNRLADT